MFNRMTAKKLDARACQGEKTLINYQSFCWYFKGLHAEDEKELEMNQRS